MSSQVSKLSTKQFLNSYGSSYDRVFTGELAEETAFVDKSWEMILLAGDFWGTEDCDFDPVRLAALSVGDQHLVTTDLELRPRHELNFLLPFNRDAVEAMRGHNLMLLQFAFFGRSEKWGAVASQMDDFVLLAGDTEYMKSFFDLAGGRSAVKSQFMAYHDKYWSASGVSNADKKHMLRIVGW